MPAVIKNSYLRLFEVRKSYGCKLGFREKGDIGNFSVNSVGCIIGKVNLAECGNVKVNNYRAVIGVAGKSGIVFR